MYLSNQYTQLEIEMRKNPKASKALHQAQIDWNLHKGEDMYNWSNTKRRAWILERARDILEHNEILAHEERMSQRTHPA